MKTTCKILPLFFILSISEHVLLWRYMLCWGGAICVIFYVRWVGIQYVVYVLWRVLCVLCFTCVCGCLKKIVSYRNKILPRMLRGFFVQGAQLVPSCGGVVG